MRQVELLVEGLMIYQVIVKRHLELVDIAKGK